MFKQFMLRQMFEDIRASAPWSIDEPCRWHYFFVDMDRAKLLAAAQDLEAMGYRVVGIVEPADRDDHQEPLHLHVERVELHTVDSLDKLNQELYRFAEEHGLESYDGMDVGPAK